MSRKSFLAVLLVVSLLLIAGVTASAGKPVPLSVLPSIVGHVTIEGQVTIPNGMTLRVSERCSGRTWHVQVDQSGNFTLTDVPTNARVFSLRWRNACALYRIYGMDGQLYRVEFGQFTFGNCDPRHADVACR